MKVTNLNPGNDIGASAWWVEFEGHHLLLDSGTHPKHDGREALPLFDRVLGRELDAIAVSHCHLDHVGSLPVALRHFPHANVLMTDLSYLLIERVLHNSVNVMMRQRTELGIKDYPFYSHEEVDDFAAVCQGFRYRREIEWGAFHKSKPGHKTPSLEFFDAGHAFGSAGILIRARRRTLFYTGDVCFHDQTLLRRAEFDDVRADILVMETTRGSNEVPENFSRESEVERFATAIEAVLKRRGSVLVPAFALGRTQEVLAILSLLMRKRRLKRQPIYIGGLGRVFTELYDIESNRANRNHPSLKLTEELHLEVLSGKQALSIPFTGGKIFVLTSGMMVENTGAHDLALRMMQDPKHGIFFVGYSDPATPAGRLRAAQDGSTFEFSAQAPDAKRLCDVQQFDLTAHANRGDLVNFVGQVNPKVVVLGHGEPEARAWFANAIQKEHPRIKVFQPGPGEQVDC